MHHHEHNGARARSARIRLAHDDEATRLETMRRHSLPVEPPESRPTTFGRFAAAFARLSTRATLGRRI
jgi:hypothetical protein